MPYNVILSDGTRNIVIPPQQVATNLASIPLVGQDYPGYGAAIATAQLHMLENFSSSTPPANPFKGQLWYDAGNDLLKVYDGVVWLSVAGDIEEFSDLTDVNTVGAVTGSVLRFDASLGPSGVWTAQAPPWLLSASFLSLTDTPGSYTANGFPRVNAGGTGLIYTTTIPASVISGELDVSAIPNLPASRITSGEFSLDRIPSLPASKITSGVFSLDRLPDMPTSRITSGVFASPRISASSVLQHAVTITTTNGVTGGGILNANLTLQVDGTVVRDFGDQSIAGIKSFTGAMNATTITATGAVTALSFSATSAAQYKENIDTLSGALAVIDRIRPIQFNWKNRTQEGRQLGFLADEVAQVLPDSVSRGTGGEIEGMQYNHIIALLVGAVNELSEEVRRLRDAR